jgi:hypothetical protein
MDVEAPEQAPAGAVPDPTRLAYMPGHQEVLLQPNTQPVLLLESAA